MSTLVLALAPLVVAIQCEEEQYSVEEEAGYVTLILVLDNSVVLVLLPRNTLLI